MSGSLFEAIGARVKEARESKGYSMEQLGRRLADLTGRPGYSASAIYFWETGKRRFPIEDLPFFAKALGVPVNFFLTGTGLDSSRKPPARVLLRATKFLNPVASQQIVDFVEEVEHTDLPTPGVCGLDSLSVPEQILAQCNIRNRPVDPVYVANCLGALVIPREFDDSVSAVLVILDHMAAIGVNALHPPERQRFGCAHELGHFVLKHVDYVNVDVTGLDGQPQGDPRLEREASTWAAQLLMPGEWVARDFRQFDGDLTKLASLYRVSKQAMWIRLGELGLAPVPA